MPSLQDLIGQPPATFGTVAKPTAPMPPARNGLNDLLNFIKESQGMYHRSPWGSAMDSVTPSLGTLLMATAPALKMPGGNAMAPGRGAPSAAEGMPIPEGTVQSHLAQMRPLPNQGIKPLPEVMATEGMPGDAAEAAINRAYGIQR